MQGFSAAQRARLLELLGQKKELIAAFRDLTVRQAEILAAEDTDALEANLGERGRLIDEVERLHQELGALMQSYSLFARGLPADDAGRRSVEALEAETRALLLETQEKDAENREAGKKLMEHFGAEGQRLSLERRTLEVYSQSGTLPQESARIDQTQ